MREMQAPSVTGDETFLIDAGEIGMLGELPELRLGSLVELEEERKMPVAPKRGLDGDAGVGDF
jgi:hypothetical protein